MHPAIHAAVAQTRTDDHLAAAATARAARPVGLTAVAAPFRARRRRFRARITGGLIRLRPSLLR
jgi:hypothetical protein